MTNYKDYTPAVEVGAVLCNFATQEFCAMIAKAQLTLGEFGYEELDRELLNIAYETSDIDAAQLIDGISECATRHVVNILQEHHITADPSSGLDTLVQVLYAVLNAPTWPDRDAVLAIAHQDSSEEDKLIDLTKLMGDPRNPHIGVAIFGVSETFFERISAMVSGEVLDTEDTLEYDPVQLAKLKDYKAFAGNLMCFKLLELGYRVGSAFSSYLDRTGLRLVALNNQEAALEIAGFALLSRNAWQEPLLGWSQNSHVLGMELHELEGLSSELKRVLNEFDTYKAKQK